MSFAVALLPDTYRVAGLRLRPHSIGHALLLQRMESPYAGRPPAASSGPDVKLPPLGDLAFAVWLCRREPASALASLERTRAPFSLGIAAWRIARHGADRAREELLEYLRAAWPPIAWWSGERGKTRTLGAELLHRVTLTQRRLGLSLAQAQQVPLAVALWDQAAHAEENGAVTIQSDTDRDLLERAEFLQASGLLPKPGTVMPPRK